MTQTTRDRDAANASAITPSKRDRLIRAIDTADRLKEEGVATARDNIGKPSEMSDALQQKLTGVADSG